MESIIALLYSVTGENSLTTDATVHLFSVAMILVAIPTAIILLFYIPAPYGRYTEATGWGVLCTPRVAWTLQECPTLIWVAYGLTYGHEAQLKAPNLILLGLFTLHYVNRTLVYPCKIRGKNDTPLSIVFLAGLFCAWNGYIQVSGLTKVVEYDPNYIVSTQFVSGVTIFLVGMFINIQADEILLKLRKPGDMNYYIPFGGMFKYVSCANFFGEIVEWTGFAIAADSLQAVAFVMYTICNVLPRALSHHRWYKQKFGEKYPKGRKAVIPFLL